MAVRIVHFGIDRSAVVSTLAQSGYEVNECGTSLPRLETALQQPGFDAVVVSESHIQPGDELSRIRSRSPVPLILFQSGSKKYPLSSFDLIVPHLTSPADWLKELADLIELARAMCDETKLACKRYASAAEQSASLIQESMGHIEQSRAIHTQTKMVHEQAVFAGKASATRRLRSIAVRNQAVSEGEPGQHELLTSEPAFEKRRESGFIPFEWAAPAPVRTIRILVVDDYPPWHKMVRVLLEEHTHLQIVGSAADGMTAINQAKELRPDIILMDIALPGVNGIEAAMRIQQLVPSAAILFLTMNSSAAIASHVLNHGAKGYVLKTTASNDLWPAIQSILQGKQYVSGRVHVDEDAQRC